MEGGKVTPAGSMSAGLLIIAGIECLCTQIPDRLSLVRIPAQPGVATQEPLAFIDVFTRGLEGIPDFRWPHIVHIPPRGNQAASGPGTLLALASGCNATVVCSSAHPWPCCLDTDEQMLMLRRSSDGGTSWSNLTYPYLQPHGHAAGRWPFPPNVKAGGQILFDPVGGRVWLFFAVIQAHDAPHGGCVGDGQDMRGLMLSSSSDLGLTWSRPQNLSTAIASQWPSLCLAPAGGNSMLIIEPEDAPRTAGQTDRRLLLMADVAGTIPQQPHLHGEVMLHVTLPRGLDSTDPLQVSVSRSLLRNCVDRVSGASCTFDEAAMALLPRTSSQPATVFVVMRSDPNPTHQYATATSTDGGVSFGPVRFQSQLASVACEASAVAVGSSLYVAAPQLGNSGHLTNPQGRYNMTVMMSSDGGLGWSVLRSVFAGPSMYSNLAATSRLDPGGGANDELLLFFERAGDHHMDARAGGHS